MMPVTGSSIVRAFVKRHSRDGARIAFNEVEEIARAPHVVGRGWYGLRRIAADMVETETADDRVKDRLGGWQDSETRKRIYQDRETQLLRAEAANAGDACASVLVGCLQRIMGLTSQVVLRRPSSMPFSRRFRTSKGNSWWPASTDRKVVLRPPVRPQKQTRRGPQIPRRV